MTISFARPLRYCFVSAGVSDRGGASFAGNDAQAMYDLFVGGAGPLAGDDHGAYVLLDQVATAANLDACFAAIASQRPDVVVFFFAGHANGRGIVLSGSLYSYARLKQKIAATAAPRSLVVLDACMTGNYAALFEKSEVNVGGLGGLVADRDFRAALVASTPGPRIVTATDRTHTTGQGRVLAGQGDLTGALLIAARHAPGKMVVGRTLFVRDDDWFAQARRILLQHGLAQGPQYRGAGAPFPIVRAEASAALGSTSVLGARLVAGGHAIDVDLHAVGRRSLGTRVDATVTSSLTGPVADFSAIWTPEAAAWSESITCSISGRLDDGVHRYWGPYGFGISIFVRVSDGHGRTLATSTFGWSDLRYVA